MPVFSIEKLHKLEKIVSMCCEMWKKLQIYVPHTITRLAVAQATVEDEKLSIKTPRTTLIATLSVFLNFSFTNCIDIDNLSYEALNMVRSYMPPSLLCQMAQTNERALYLVAHLLRWTITPSTMETHHAYLLA